MRGRHFIYCHIKKTSLKQLCKPARTMVTHRRVPKRWKFPALRRRALGYTFVWSRMMLRGVRAAMSTSLLNTGVAWDDGARTAF